MTAGAPASVWRAALNVQKGGSYDSGSRLGHIVFLDLYLPSLACIVIFFSLESSLVLTRHFLRSRQRDMQHTFAHSEAFVATMETDRQIMERILGSVEGLHHKIDGLQPPKGSQELVRRSFSIINLPVR